MNKLHKFKPAILIALIATIVVYIINIVNVALFANNITDVTSTIGTLSKFVDQQYIDAATEVINVATGALTAYKSFTIGLLVIGGLFTTIVICITRWTQSKYEKSSKLLYLILFTLLSAYIAYSSVTGFESPNNFPAMLMLLLNIYNLVLFTVLTVFGGITACKQFKADFHKQAWVKTGATIIGSFSLIVIILLSVNVFFRGVMYISVASFISSIDLGALINIMDYVNIDFSSILPDLVGASGVITQSQIDTVVNNFFDQSVLAFASTQLHQFLNGIALNIIFNNFVIVVIGLGTSIASFIFARKVEPEEIVVEANEEATESEVEQFTDQTVNTEIEHPIVETEKEHKTFTSQFATSERDNIILLVCSLLAGISIMFVSTSIIYIILAVAILLGSLFILFGIIQDFEA